MNENLKNYNNIIQELEESSAENHLLLGNGFNTSLGINTSYSGIFEKMKKDHKEYNELNDYMKTVHYDIEKLIGKLKGSLHDGDKNYSFLCNFIESKVKLDFMKACYTIVKSNIKNIYHEKNEDVYLLFKNFTNFFSLNYDPFLYLLLMKFKKTGGQAIALQNSNSLIKEDMNSVDDNIYSLIKEAKRDGKFKVTVNNKSLSDTLLSSMSKNNFTSIIKAHFKSKNWKEKDINFVCDKIWEEENKSKKLNDINDGFFSGIYNKEYTDNITQNIFFLHGVFHIYTHDKTVHKITQKKDKALYQKLEEIIHEDDKEIVCVLTNDTKDKKQQINDNEYLKNSLKKLSTLTGSLVIFGSSLAENDMHIFEEINKSEIKAIYISTSENNYDTDLIKAQKIFPNIQLHLFNYMSVSYISKESDE